jgi:hypothetical protein
MEINSSAPPHKWRRVPVRRRDVGASRERLDLARYLLDGTVLPSWRTFARGGHRLRRRASALVQPAHLERTLHRGPERPCVGEAIGQSNVLPVKR